VAERTRQGPFVPREASPEVPEAKSARAVADGDAPREDAGTARPGHELRARKQVAREHGEEPQAEEPAAPAPDSGAEAEVVVEPEMEEPEVVGPVEEPEVEEPEVVESEVVVEPELEEPEDELAVARREREEYLALAQRTQADFDNYRKRAAKDVANAGERAKRGLVTELLPVIDNLERALESGGDEEHLAGGVRLVHSALVAVLSRNGVEQFDPRGERFDPTLHEALTTRSEEGSEAGVVLDVVEKGYSLNGNVLRPARVVVSG
jgi:molecular chaperone GrpE